MNKVKLIPVLAAGVMTLVLAVGAVTYRSVYAQATTPTTPSTTVPAQAGPGGERGPRGELRGGATSQDLADALGIDLADLQAAEQTAAQAALDLAVEQGLITQEQAEQFSTAGKGLRHMPRMAVANGIDPNALLADALGIGVDELQSARQTAMTTAIDRALEAGTLTQEQADLMKGSQALFTDDQFQASMTSAFEAAVNQAVSSGVITQAQADQILARTASKGFFGRGGFGLPGMGGRHPGRHGGFDNGAGDDI
jgi:ribosomal protein S20